MSKEYYINDSGRQIRTLGTSVWFRLRELVGTTVDFPEDCYKGDYIKGMAREVLDREGLDFINNDEDNAIDICARYAAGRILAQIRQDLVDFGVTFDQWFSEQSLYDSGRVQQSIEVLKKRVGSMKKTGPCGSRPKISEMRKTGWW